MATYNYSGYDDDQVIWPGGTPTSGDTITFTIPTDHLISITDNDTSLQDGIDDRDDEDSTQTVIVYDEFGNPEASGQVQPRDEITLSDGTNSYRMTEIYIASSNSYYYIFQGPAPQMGVQYTVTSVTNPNSTSYSSFSNEGVVCFAAGTLILTPRGEVPVESLCKGDLVTTMDHGPRRIRLVVTRRLKFPASPEKHKPIEIKADTLGLDCPKRDLCVSPQHRMLITDARLSRALGLTEALVPAKGLIRLRGVRQKLGCMDVEYIHLVFDQHEIIFAEGAPTESFFPGPVARRNVEIGVQQELTEIFPHLSPETRDTTFDPARMRWRRPSATAS
ncbi:MAG: Hint domain-containing protein [Sulfitobacter sp.]